MADEVHRCKKIKFKKEEETDIYTEALTHFCLLCSALLFIVFRWIEGVYEKQKTDVHYR